MTKSGNAKKTGKGDAWVSGGCDIKLYIYGAGGHGKVVFHTFTNMGKAVTAFLDDKPTLERRCGLPILTPAAVQDLSPYTIHFAIGNNRIRHDLQTAWQQRGAAAATAIHPRATCYPTATIGTGSLLTAGSILGSDANIGDGCILNHNSVVEHDAVIGDFCHIAQNAVVGGGVRLGTQCLVGAGAVILPCLTIGNHVTIAAGATVTHDLPDNSTFPPPM
jgi:sugar O-acyltransferase (sialic acid O-acetyltransferase NeuD family)